MEKNKLIREILRILNDDNGQSYIKLKIAMQKMNLYNRFDIMILQIHDSKIYLGHSISFAKRGTRPYFLNTDPTNELLGFTLESNYSIEQLEQLLFEIL